MEKDDLSSLMAKVADEAKKDGVITVQELYILKQLSYDVAEYMIALEDAKKDQIITEEEERDLIRLKNKILENATNVAEFDGIIEEDERNLLKKVAEVLKNMKDPSSY